MFHVISTFILLIHYPPKIVCTCDSPQQQREGELHLLVSAELLRQASWDNVQCHHYNVRIMSLQCAMYPLTSRHLPQPGHAAALQPDLARGEAGQLGLAVQGGHADLRVGD